jgi:hypothetical protein
MRRSFGKPRGLTLPQVSAGHLKLIPSVTWHNNARRFAIHVPTLTNPKAKIRSSGMIKLMCVSPLAVVG